MAARPIGTRFSCLLQSLPLLILLLLLPADVPTSVGQPPVTAPGSSAAPEPSSPPTSPSPHERAPPPAQSGSPGGGGGGSSSGNIGAKGSSSGMSAGKKAGIAFVVIIGGEIVGLGGYVYTKRRGNIRRSRYAYAARLHQL